MPIRVVCPQGHKILAPEKRAGQRILCPRCRSQLRVPSLEPADTPPIETSAPEQSASKDSPRGENAASDETVAHPPPKIVGRRPAAEPAPEARKQRWKGEPGAGSTSQENPSQGKPSADAAKPRATPPPLPARRRKETPAEAPRPSAPPAAEVARREEGRIDASAGGAVSDLSTAKSEPAKNEPSPPDRERTSPSIPREAAPAEPRASNRRHEPTRDDPAPTETESLADESPESPQPVVGMRHRPERVRGVYLFAAVLASLALFGLIPAVMEGYDYLQSEGEQPLARWLWLALLLGLVQLSYATYAAQLPDWSTLWSTAVATLAVAMLYAMLYAVTLLGDADSALLAWLQVHATQTDRAAGWCFVMLSLNGIYAYFCGRAGSHWRHTAQLRNSLGLQ